MVVLQFDGSATRYSVPIESWKNPAQRSAVTYQAVHLVKPRYLKDAWPVRPAYRLLCAVPLRRTGADETGA